MTTTTISRRLLSPDETAGKLGYSRAWLSKNRDRLEEMGFPRPILGGGFGSPLRWDERAIDLWLDSKMSQELLSGARIDLHVHDTREIEKKLSERAMGMVL